MGLTVAEAFMLITFVLLFLLVYWLQGVQEKEKDAQLVNKPAVRELAREAAELPPEALRKLTDLVRQPESLTAGAKLVQPHRLKALEQAEKAADGRNLQEIAEALDLRKAMDPSGATPIKELIDSSKLVADPGLRKFAREVASLPPEGLRKLTDLVRQPDSLTAGAKLVQPHRLKALEQAEKAVDGRNLQEIAEALDLRKAMDPSGATPIKELIDSSKLVADPGLRKFAREVASLPPEGLRKLTDLVRRPKSLTAGAKLVQRQRLEALEQAEKAAAGRNLQEIAEALDLREAMDPSGATAFEELIDTGKLVADPGVRKLAQEAAELPPEALRKLADLVRRPKSLTAGAELVQRQRLEALEQTEKATAGRNRQEISEALLLREALDPYDEYGNEELLASIAASKAKWTMLDGRRADEAQSRKAFVEGLRSQLAEYVKAAGGRIDADGRIEFLQSVFFESGRAEIAPRFKDKLNDLCPRWLETLKSKSAKLDVEEARIEGHSSPEWTSASSEQEAWVENLSLSQRRAQSVLVHCLESVWQKPLGSWAREKLIAVGYSSSRPVITDDGAKDRLKSRRVVLGHAFVRETPISSYGDTQGTGSEAIGPIRGKAQAKDADTIRIGEYIIRLKGVDAPELDQICTEANGDEWPCGDEARKVLALQIGDREIICDDLQQDPVQLWGRCRLDGESQDLNRWIVNEGWAFAHVRQTEKYSKDETAARKARRGIWTGNDPVPPWEWRRDRKRGSSQP